MTITADTKVLSYQRPQAETIEDLIRIDGWLELGPQGVAYYHPHPDEFGNETWVMWQTNDGSFAWSWYCSGFEQTSGRNESLSEAFNSLWAESWKPMCRRMKKG
jgi:hypothetical protein